VLSPKSKKRQISKCSNSISNNFKWINLFIVSQAFEMKEQGNEFYRQKDFKRALAKYARV
jgi:hypothetical protein